MGAGLSAALILLRVHSVSVHLVQGSEGPFRPSGRIQWDMDALRLQRRGRFREPTCAHHRRRCGSPPTTTIMTKIFTIVLVL